MRRFTIPLLGFLLLGLGGAGLAQTYPAKPIRMILPFPPGGPTDILGRMITQKLTEQMGQPVVADNRPGATGVLGTVRVTPNYWRVHVFGDRGSAEALGETELVLRMTGEKPQRLTYEPVDALRLELDAFADAGAGRSPFPVPPAQMIDTIAALEAMNRAMDSNTAVAVGCS
jgi:hypothetical protein